MQLHDRLRTITCNCIYGVCDAILPNLSSDLMTTKISIYLQFLQNAVWVVQHFFVLHYMLYINGVTKLVEQDGSQSVIGLQNRRIMFGINREC